MNISDEMRTETSNISNNHKWYKNKGEMCSYFSGGISDIL